MNQHGSLLQSTRMALKQYLPHFVVAVVVLYSFTLFSQTAPVDQVQPRRLRFDVTPLFGYRTSMSFPTGEENQPSSPRLHFDSHSSYGIAGGFRPNEEDVIEFRWARQDSRVHLKGSTPPLKTDVVLNQYSADFTHEYILDDWPTWGRPFVIGNIGATRFAAPGVDFTRFSFGVGGGIKVFFNRHVGMRMQAEWLPIVVSPEVVSFVCGAGCAVRLKTTLTSQGEVVAGPLFRF